MDTGTPVSTKVRHLVRWVRVAQTPTRYKSVAECNPRVELYNVIENDHFARVDCKTCRNSRTA